MKTATCIAEKLFGAECMEVDPWPQPWPWLVPLLAVVLGILLTIIFVLYHRGEELLREERQIEWRERQARTLAERARHDRADEAFEIVARPVLFIGGTVLGVVVGGLLLRLFRKAAGR